MTVTEWWISLATFYVPLVILVPLLFLLCEKYINFDK